MKQYCVGTRVSAERIYFGVFEISGKPIEFWTEETLKEKGCKSVLQDLTLSLKRKLKNLKIAEQSVLGIGISVPGEVDYEGVMHYSTELGWGIVNIRSLLHKASRMHVVVGSSRDMAILGEYWARDDNTVMSVAGFMVGNTLQGSVIVHNQLVFDRQGVSGDLGKLPVFRELPRIDQKMLLELLGQDEPMADKIIDSVIEAIINAIKNIECIIKAEKVIIFTDADADISVLLQKIRGRYQKLAGGNASLQIECSRLGEYAEVYGSAKYVFETCDRERDERLDKGRA